MTQRILVLAVVLAATPTLQADTVGGLRGLAKDETGSPLAGVTADVRGLTASLERSVTTDVRGVFEIADLPPGRYQVALRLPSFATTVRTVEIGAGSVVRIEATLRIALNADVLVTGRRTFRSLTDLDEPVNGLLGLAEAGSTGVVTAHQIEERLVFRSGRSTRPCRAS
jgi:Carboxypeptidase regulatory-like domain